MVLMTAPPDFLPVLLQHGVFLKDKATGATTFRNGQPDSLLPPPGKSLETLPSLEAQRTWPTPAPPTPTQTHTPGHTPTPDYRDDSVVLLAISVNTDCKDTNVVTEIGYTVYDTLAVTHGVNRDKFRRWNVEEGIRAPDDRGQKIYIYGTTCHAIVRETRLHHPKTCREREHSAQPYHFAFRKSEFITAEQIPDKLHNVFKHASCTRLNNVEVKHGKRRPVVLLSWNGEVHDVIKSTEWYKNGLFAHWNVRQQPTIRKRYDGGPYISLEAAWDGFGIEHKVQGMEIGNNAGNRSAFLMRLLIAVCFLTEEDHERVKQRINLKPAEGTLKGAESILVKSNLPPGSKAEPDEAGKISIWACKG
ncbi:hypothetical protein F5Y18DRAFT_432433 [Xylariaceae sp. FL1019]|nr:hypothetical protein F5Y18DRAFT_432433 [Xylariaceae sp. FL1019]